MILIIDVKSLIRVFALSSLHPSTAVMVATRKDLFTWQIIKINPYNCLSQHKKPVFFIPFMKLFYVCHHQHKYSAGERCFTAFHYLFQGLFTEYRNVWIVAKLLSSFYIHLLYSLSLSLPLSFFPNAHHHSNL